MTKTAQVALVVSCVLVGTCIGVEDTWTDKADMPTARVFVGGCVIDGRIYVVSGAPSEPSVTPAVEMYDPVDDTWTKLANLPSARCYPATCAVDGAVYVFGGTSPSMWATATKSVYVYDAAADAWTQKADMPHAIAGCGVAAVDGIVYLIGGARSTASPPVSRVLAYDPVADSWAQKTDMPTARGFLSACVVDGMVYAIGGCTESWGTFSYKCVEVYDPLTDTWRRRSEMPTQRWGLGTCVVDGRIYAIGGSTVGAASTTANEVYDSATDTWAAACAMRQKRYGLFVGSVGEKVYAIGGSVPGFLKVVEEYDTGLGVPSPDLNGDGFVEIEDLLMLIECWGQDDPAADLAPEPFGDGVVDALDLEVMMSVWGEEIYDPAMIAYWALDEGEGTIAYDSAGQNDASLVNGPAWQSDAGMIGGALGFDGVDDRVETPSVLSPADGAFSVFAWVQGGAAGQVIVSQSGGNDWLLTGAGGALMTDLNGSGRQAKALCSEAVITDGQWHRVGLVWEGRDRALYVDDVTAAEDEPGLAPDFSEGLHIGAGAHLEAGSYFCGLIDDVRLYERAVRP